MAESQIQNFNHFINYCWIENKILQIHRANQIFAKYALNMVFDKKFAKSNIDPNILFEVFLMGLDNDGEQTPQQKGFMSLNTFMAEDYNTPAASEVGDEKQPYEAAITNLALNTKNRNMAIKSYHYGPLNLSLIHI